MGENDKKPSGSTDAPSKQKWNNRKKRHGNDRHQKPATHHVKFSGGKDELDGNYFDCTGYGQSDRFVKTVQKIADYIGQEYKSGGITRTEVVTQTPVVIPVPRRLISISVTQTDGSIVITPPDVLDISDYQSAKKILDYKVQHQTEN